MDSLRDLLGIRRINRVPSGHMREIYGVTKGVDEMTDGNILQWFGHIEKMEKMVFVRECLGNWFVVQPRK